MKKDELFAVIVMAGLMILSVLLVDFNAHLGYTFLGGIL